MPGCEVNLNTEGLTAREVKTFKVTGQPEIVLDTFDGAIELHSWDRNEIEVEVEKRAMEQTLLDEIKIDAQQQGDKIVIKVTGPARPEHRGVTIGMHISPTARLRVAVPRIANINATSGDGSIRAEAIEGKLVLRTTDGSVTGTRLGGDIQIRSGDGSIQARQHHRQARSGDRRRQHWRGGQADRASPAHRRRVDSRRPSSPIR